MLCLETLVVFLRNGANGVHNVPKQLFSTFAVPKKLDGEDFGQAFVLPA